LLEPYSKISLSLVSESFQRKPRPSKIVQRVDEGEAARQVETACPAALAEAAEQIVFRQSGQPLTDQPVHQAQAGREFHQVIMPRYRV